MIWSSVGFVCPKSIFRCRQGSFVSAFLQFINLFLALTFWDAKLGTIRFPRLYVRSDWRTQCVGAAVDWTVIYFIRFDRHLEAWLERFCGFWCCFQFLLHCWKTESMSKSSGACHFVSRFLWIWSGRLQSCCLLLVPLGLWDDRLLVLLEDGSVPVWSFRDSSLGVGWWTVWMLSTDGLFFTGGELRGMLADKTLDSLAGWCAWFGQSLRPGKPSNSPYAPTRITRFNDEIIKLAWWWWWWWWWWFHAMCMNI